MPAFRPVPSDVSFPTLEEEVLGLWARHDTFRKSVEDPGHAGPDAKGYVFYDGPPFATGLPHYGHLVASTLKDIVPRYWTMKGHRVERRFGWDTHGLPIEMEIEKQLGLNGPTSVREYGVARFNEACRENVLRYTAEWERTVTRLGRWVDFANDYKTMDLSFMESVWWVFKRLWDTDLVYQDFRVMPFSWRLSTSLSNFEANLDYRDVQDPAITVTMPDLDSGDVLLVWTTTPWTLPSNLAIAVGADLDYVRARRQGDDTVYIVVAEQAAKILGEGHAVVQTLKGADLVGRRYQPLFDYFAGHDKAFQVIASGHVTTGDGTGLVHMAPDFGEEDFKACKAVGIQLLLSVDDEGRFVSAVTDYAGRNVKEADPDIIRALKARGRLFKQDTIQHSYPYCWRSGTPLIYKAVPTRFVRAERLRERMQAHNDQIHWVPEAVGSKRFGNWLADARDWNIGRNRFWGTPIPVWRCDQCHHEVCMGSVAELEAATVAARAGARITDLHPHKIDHLVFPCDCGGQHRRIPDVFDCWFESGSMPYAQDHYPFENKNRFEANFPAQFIAEGLDQTRGWFYTLLVLSTALFDREPFKNCIVNGMVLAEDGSKMSKSKRNYPPPDRILDEHGADALRAYLINSPIVRAEPLRFSEDGVREVVRTVLLPLRNAWSFFVQYANIDGWSPVSGLTGVATPDVADRPELDRWLLSVLQSLVAEVNEQMEGYYLYKVVPPVLGFIDHLTNWYIRRSRRRFWRSADDVAGQIDKSSAYATLYEALVTFARLLAPIMPFMAEAMYQNLVVGAGVTEEGDSVHLCAYPTVREAWIDAGLEAQVALTRQVVTLGRALREKHRLPVRQPLLKVTVVHHDPAAIAAVSAHSDLVAEELNVKAVVVRPDDTELATLSFKPDFKRLGRRMGKRMREASETIAALTPDEWARLNQGLELSICDQAVTLDDIQVVRQARGDVVIEVDGAITVALDTELTPALVREGLAREVTSRLQRLRKDNGFEVTDRVLVRLYTDSEELAEALREQRDWVAGEALAEVLEVQRVGAGLGDLPELGIKGHEVRVAIQRA